MTRSADARPLYEQVADDLRAAIERGDLAPNSPIQPEQELAEHYEVSRQTVRLALQQLASEGLVTSGRGRGRTVRSTSRLRWHLATFESQSRHGPDADAWANEVKEQGREPHQEISVSIDRPTKKVSERLNIDPDSEFVVVRRRIRYVDGSPFQLADSYFPEFLVRGTPLMQPEDVSAPGGLLASIGHPQARLVDEIQTRMPTKDESAKLGLTTGTPVVEHVRTGYKHDGTPLRVMITIAPGDRNTLIYELDAS